MNALRRVMAVMAVAVATAAVSGCASLVERSYPGEPPESRLPATSLSPSPSPGSFGLPDPDLGPRAQWADDGRLLAVTLGGSSTCPTEPKALTVEAPDRLLVEVSQRGGFFGACTADLAFVTYEVRVPDELAASVPVTVTVGDTSLDLPPRRGG